MAQSINLGKIVPEKGVDYFTEADIQEVRDGMQPLITNDAKVASDLIDDTNSTLKFTNATEKATWNGKQDALTAGSNITISSNVINTNGDTIKDLSTNLKINVAGLTGLYRTTTSISLLRSRVEDTPFTTISQGAIIDIAQVVDTPLTYSIKIFYGPYIIVYQYNVLSDSFNILQKTTDLTIVEQTDNKVTSISSSSTDVQYPSAKAVYDYVGTEIGNITTALQTINTGNGV